MPEMRRVPVDQSGKKRPEMPSFDRGPVADTPPSIIEDAPEVEAGCACPRLDAADWHEVESDWSDIVFLKGSISAVMGVPIGYGDLKRGLAEKAKKLGATVPEDAMFLLGEGRFRRQILLEVESAPAGKDFARPGGVAYTRLVPAPWGEMKSVIEETEAAASDRYGRKADDIWLWYLTCRECSADRNFETLVVAHYRRST